MIQRIGDLKDRQVVCVRDGSILIFADSNTAGFRRVRNEICEKCS